MKKLRLFQHTSLDGFVAGPNGEMDFINISEELFDITNHYSSDSDSYIMGRKTFEMMEGYWPMAGQQPNATKHDKAHSEWYNQVAKIVISNTLAPKPNTGTRVINKNLKVEIEKLKQAGGKDVIMFGSASAAHALMELDLIDEYGLFVNPVLLGKGIPMFSSISSKLKLNLITSKPLVSGVIFLLYQRENKE